MPSNKEQSSSIIEEPIKTVGLMLKQKSDVLPLFVFSVDGKQICRHLGIRRMKWQGSGYPPEGYQRNLESKRVETISRYLDKNRILPNAIVVAFETDTLKFNPLPGLDKGMIQVVEITLLGKLIKENGNNKPCPEDQRIGYVIDGQHRIKGIETSAIGEGTFPIVICAYCGANQTFQLNQFYALNQTVSITQSWLAMLRNLLNIAVGPKEARQQAVSKVREILQNKAESPFEPDKYMKVSKLIKKGNLDITVVERMVDRAVKSTRLKFKWNEVDASEIPDKDIDEIAQNLFVFWKAVQETFPGYWGKKPKDQRLFSAIGLYTLVLFFDRIMADIDVVSADAVAKAKQGLKPFADIRWDDMSGLPSVPKGVYPQSLFTALNLLLQNGTARPYTFKVVEPATKIAFVEQHLK